MTVNRIVAMVVTCFIIVSGARAFAQEASVIGTVTDETKAALPGATITATDLATGRKAVGVADGRGEYRLLNLPPGQYKVQADLSGFASVVVPAVELLVGQNATLPITLKLASVAETVTVTGESPLVDTSSNQVAGNVDRRQMESLPLQGRNWLELSMLVKGVTANTIGDTPGVNDDQFQLNLDGQQITQKIASSSFGQPRFSRDAIAEFQIVTNQFDITQGRSTGVQVQAISRSGTNATQGSVYGYFRDDRFNAPDPITQTVLPFENQQVGGTLGGPIVKDKLHYFGSYEYERQPGTTYAAPAALPGESFVTPNKISQKSALVRVDDQLSTRDRLSARGSRWDWSNPFVGTNHPSNASAQTRGATNVLGTWSRVISDTKVMEVRAGYNNFQWANVPLPSMLDTVEYDFPGLTIGAPYNYPQWFYQDNLDTRYDLSWHRNTHDIKFGGEFIYIHDTATWYLQKAGRMTFSSVPADITTRVPQSAALDPSQWNLTGLDSIVQKFDQNFNAGDWLVDVPRPTWALWFGDNWRVSNQLTINYGVRWDVDWGATAAPDIVTNTILIDNNSAAAGTRLPSMAAGDFGYKSGIHDNRNVAPRAGFTWNVGGSNSLVIRGGSGLYFSTPVSNVSYSPQVFSQDIAASFANDGLPGFVQNPTRGITTFDQAKAALPPQSPRVISADFRNPYTWQTSIGFQKRIDEVTGFDVDLVHFNEYRDTRSIDPNLFYDPVTGYNKNPAAVKGVANRPNPNYGQLLDFVSNGQDDYTAIASALNRRFKNRFQAGLTYTLMLAMHDDGSIGYTSPGANNQFDYLDGEYATATGFQRNTVRLWTVYQMPWGISANLLYAYGSGTRYNATIATNPFGKVGSNRLNLTASGGATSAIVIPADVLDRWNGPAVINSGDVIPRNALSGLPIHKVDLRLTKEVRLHGTMKVSLIGEVFNLFNRANYSGFRTSLSATAPATTVLFGQPSAAQVSRQGQLAFKVSF
jgi:hypothetical protein